MSVSYTHLDVYKRQAAHAIEQLAVQGAVGVTDFGHTVLIPKLCVAFLTGHQIKLLHFLSLIHI